MVYQQKIVTLELCFQIAHEMQPSQTKMGAKRFRSEHQISNRSINRTIELNKFQIKSSYGSSRKIRLNHQIGRRWSHNWLPVIWVTVSESTDSISRRGFATRRHSPPPCWFSHPAGPRPRPHCCTESTLRSHGPWERELGREGSRDSDWVTGKERWGGTACCRRPRSWVPSSRRRSGNWSCIAAAAETDVRGAREPDISRFYFQAFTGIYFFSDGFSSKQM
jgi:hypothetical protein